MDEFVRVQFDSSSCFIITCLHVIRFGCRSAKELASVSKFDNLEKDLRQCLYCVFPIPLAVFCIIMELYAIENVLVIGHFMGRCYGTCNSERKREIKTT